MVSPGDDFNFHLILTVKIPAEFDGVLWQERAVLSLALSYL